MSDFASHEEKNGYCEVQQRQYRYPNSELGKLRGRNVSAKRSEFAQVEMTIEKFFEKRTTYAGVSVLMTEETAVEFARSLLGPKYKIVEA